MTSTITLPVKCTECNAELTTPIVCTGCHRLYPVPQSVDYFALFGLTPRYDLDVGALSAAFRSITRNIHPDRFAGQTGEMLTLATRLSAEINSAYRVLKDPVLRADYLLELRGGPSASEERGVPPEWLMEVMSIREGIEAAQADDDLAGLSKIRADLDARRHEALSRIGALASALDSADEEARRRLRIELNGIKYLDNLLHELPSDPFE